MFDFRIYQSEIFLNIIEEVYKIERVYPFGDEVLDLVTTFYISKKKKGNIFSLPFNFYYSPRLGNKEEIFFDALGEYSRRNNRNIVLKSLEKYDRGKYFSNEKNSILNLTQDSYGDYFKCLSKNFRQNIRTASNKINEDRRFVFEKIKSIEDLFGFYKTMSILYIDKHKMVFQPFSLFEKLFAASLADYYAVKDVESDNIVSCIVVVWDGDVCHYNWGVTHPAYYKYSFNTMLVNNLVKKCFEKNIRYLDFGTTPNSDRKLLFFKEKWKCEHFPVYHYYTLDVPKKVDLNSSYLFARNVYAMMPHSFIRHLIPRVIPWLVQ